MWILIVFEMLFGLLVLLEIALYMSKLTSGEEIKAETIIWIIRIVTTTIPLTKIPISFVVGVIIVFLEILQKNYLLALTMFLVSILNAMFYLIEYLDKRKDRGGD